MGQMRTTEGPYGITEAVSSDTIVGVRRPLAGGTGGGGGAVAPTPTAWVDDQRGEIAGQPTTVAWPIDAIEYDVQVLEGEATLVGCPDGDVLMPAGTHRHGGLPEGAEEVDTLTAWTSLEIPAGSRVVLAFTRRP